MSNITIYRFALDMTPGGVTPVVHLSQYDEAFQLEFTLYSRSGELDIPSGATAMIEGTKLDGKAYSANATISENVVTVAGDVQISAVAGNNPFQIVLKSGNSTVGSANFTISVERAAMDYDTVSDSKLAQIQDVTATAAQLTAAAENVTDGVETFEALAESVSDMLADITDDTLSITDKAADAAAVGNALAAEIAPKYSTSATYAVGDYVIYNNALYRCNTAIATAESWTAAHWTAVKIGSEIGNLKSESTDLKTIINNEYSTSAVSVNTTADGYALDGDGGYVADNEMRLAKYKIVAGLKYYIHIEKASFGVWQWQNNSSVNNNREYVVGTPYTEQTNGIFVAPPNASWLIVSERKTSATNIIECVYDFINPTYEALRTKIITVPSADIINATNSSAAIVSSTTRLCTQSLYRCHKNDIVKFVGGEVVNRIVIVKYSNTGSFVSEVTGWLYDTEFSITSDGYYRFIFKNLNDSSIMPNSYDATTTIMLYDENDINTQRLSNDLNSVEARKTSIDYVDFIPFELGDLYVNGSGRGTYYNSTTRMRTHQNNPLELCSGDIIHIVEKSMCVIVVYHKSDGLYTAVNSFINQDILIPETGEYEIVIRYPTEATITNFDEMQENVRLFRKLSILKETTNIENLVTTYQDELENTIVSAESKTTSKALMFGIITDSHLDAKRVEFYTQTMENLERLNNALHFNGIIHLGDIINGYNDSDTAKSQLRYAMDRLLQIAPDATYVVVGNHDNNNGAGNEERLTDAKLYSLIQRYNESYVTRTTKVTNSVYDSPSSDYYVDYDSFKIRAIFFDSCYYSQGFSDWTISWVNNVMAAAPNDYKFILFTHMSPENELNGGIALGNADTFKAVLATYANRIYCYIHGHSHYDYVGYPQGFAEIALCSVVPDQPSSNVPAGGIQPTRTIGSVTQDCISVLAILPDEQKVELVRFGAGDDRSIPFRQS